MKVHNISRDETSSFVFMENAKIVSMNGKFVLLRNILNGLHNDDKCLHVRFHSSLV